jgi:hypothetical protein
LTNSMGNVKCIRITFLVHILYRDPYPSY